MEKIEKWDTFLLRYPGLFLRDATAIGTVKLQGQWYRLKIICPNFPSIQDAGFDLQLMHQIKYIRISKETLPKTWTLYDFMENLPQLAQQYIGPTCLLSLSANDEALTNNIYKEIASVYAPESYKLQLNDNLNRLRFTKFVNYEQHYLQIELLPPKLLVSEHSLPNCFNWTNQLQKCNSIAAMVQQFQKYLQDLQSFYDYFTDIDELCYVVQPTPPPVSTKHNWRLFMLRDRVYLKLTINDPFAPIASMQLQILGPTQAVEELRHMLSEGLRDWDAELDIHKNLLRIFDLCYFPMPPGSGWIGTDHEAISGEQQFCNICYSYELDGGEVPIVSCDNAQCTLIYHAACLKEWFNTLTNGKDFLSVSFGACPFCKTKLSTSFAELLEN